VRCVGERRALNFSMLDALASGNPRYMEQYKLYELRLFLAIGPSEVRSQRKKKGVRCQRHGTEEVRCQEFRIN
jgi:hypothetical protein